MASAVSVVAAAPATSAAQAVLGRMARALLGDDAPRRAGRFSLRPAQRAAVRAAERALAEYGGALIADAPGTGKTVLALAIAASHDDVLIIVPAALREQWQRAAQQAQVVARFETLEGLSHGRTPRAAALIIVDEAQHLRTPTTARYRAIAELAMHRRILLLSATPVVNSRRDRDALLALFLGERASVLTEAASAAVILRLASADAADVDAQRLPDLDASSDVPGLGSAVMHLPPPLPLADGAQATAIVRLTLAFAWASSLAALDVALRRRLERGRTLDERLAAGRWPSRDALRAWILGDDATQLALGFDAPEARLVPTGARDILAEHLLAVTRLRALIKPRIEPDTAARAQSLLALLAQQAPRRVLLLAHSAVTVRALYAALRAQPGIVAITGARVHAAAGRWTRAEVLAALGPTARGYDRNDPRGIRLLLATDILAEGVELQGASVLVHADPAWTPARLEQRVGRVAREGQRERVLVTQFTVPSAVERILETRARLQRKSAARTLALAAAEAEATLRRGLESWLRFGAGAAGLPQVAAIHSARCGFVALLRANGEPRLVAGEYQRGRWRMAASPGALLRVLQPVLREVIPNTALRPAPLSSAQITSVRRALRRWHGEHVAGAMIADEAGLPEPITRLLRVRLETMIAEAPLGERLRRASALGDLQRQVSALRGRGVELTLKRLLRSENKALLVELRALCRQASADEQTRPAPLAGAGRLKIDALLILVGAPEASGAALS